MSSINSISVFSNIVEDELPVSIVFIDKDNFTLVTTRQTLTRQGGIIRSAKPYNIISWEWNDFKGYTDKTFTRGQLTFSDKQVFEVFIETGKASLVTIYVIRTLID